MFSISLPAEIETIENSWSVGKECVSFLTSSIEDKLMKRSQLQKERKTFRSICFGSLIKDVTLSRGRGELYFVTKLLKPWEHICDKRLKHVWRHLWTKTPFKKSRHYSNICSCICISVELLKKINIKMYSTCYLSNILQMFYNHIASKFWKELKMYFGKTLILNLNKANENSFKLF